MRRRRGDARSAGPVTGPGPSRGLRAAPDRKSRRPGRVGLGDPLAGVLDAQGYACGILPKRHDDRRASVLRGVLEKVPDQVAENVPPVAKVHMLQWYDMGQQPFAALMRLRQTNDAVINRCQAWAESNYRTQSPVAAMTDL